MFKLEKSHFAQLRALRETFLAKQSTGTVDYWGSTDILEAYDATLARRILWKWQSALSEAVNCGFANQTFHSIAQDLNSTTQELPANISEWVDWGCGTGVATEALLECCLEHSFTLPLKIILYDRSLRAATFAAKKLKKIYADIQFLPTSIAPDINHKGVLMSHVLSELPLAKYPEFIGKLSGASALLCVEAGTHDASHRLLQLRTLLHKEFHIWAPCPHQNSCGLLKPELEKEWCHQYASVPNEIFQSAQWNMIAKELEIDLRSLPYSMLLMTRGTLENSQNENLTAENLYHRILGRPRHTKSQTQVWVCSKKEVCSKILPVRNHKQFIKSLQKNNITELILDQEFNSEN